MLKNTLYTAAFVVIVSVMGGCNLYFDHNNDGGGMGSSGYCDETGCYTCDDWGCAPDRPGAGTGEPGWDCSSNYDCAAGCFCDEGACSEAGFCTYDSDCATGYTCDDRSTCVPAGSDQACTDSSSCPSGSYCDGQSGVCVGSGACTSGQGPNADLACGPGFVCGDRNTCIPQTCTADSQCGEGCYCDATSENCVETTICDSLGNCPGALVCDVGRNTCVPAPPAPVGPTCQGTVVCALAAPVCPVGSTAAIENGCYTGACMVKTDCPDGAPFECSDLNGNENSCSANSTCSPVYKGVNCTSPNGAVCTGGSMNCTCETFQYDYCEAI